MKLKNRLTALVYVVTISALSVIMTGCSAGEAVPSQVQTDQEIQDDNETDISEVQTVPEQTDRPEEEKPDSAGSSEEALTADGQRIKDNAEKFAAAYFDGDIEAVKSCLTAPYEWDIEIYSGAGTISELTFKGLTDIGVKEAGDIQVISMEYRDSEKEDVLQYLTLEFIKQEDDWKIQFYGTEG